jgi:hypothetical protein
MPRKGRSRKQLCGCERGNASYVGVRMSVFAKILASMLLILPVLCELQKAEFHHLLGLLVRVALTIEVKTPVASALIKSGRR